MVKSVCVCVCVCVCVFHMQSLYTNVCHCTCKMFKPLFINKVQIEGIKMTEKCIILCST